MNKKLLFKGRTLVISAPFSGKIRSEVILRPVCLIHLLQLDSNGKCADCERL
jgi:hypothetical protein